MATRSSSSSSSSSESEETSARLRGVSETSRDTAQTASRLHVGSPTNTIDGTSFVETTTVRSGSPTASHTSTTVNHSVYESASTVTTGTTNATGASIQPQLVGGIPIIRPPVLQQSGTGLGVFGPQVPGGYPTQPLPTVVGGIINQPPIQIDVVSAQKQYQQRTVQPEISPYGGSSTSSSGGSLSSPGTASNQQQQGPRFDAAKAVFTQVDANKDGSISREEFRQWAQNAGQSQQQQQQTQFPNQIPAHQVYNELLGPDAFKDVILDIDYGALGELNTVFQSGSDFSGGQLPPGISVRPAYTTVDSLNYQQHMFNTARTINAGGGSNSYDFGGATSGYNVAGGEQFDVAKAIFNQADINHDGGISREEFRQWAQSGQSHPSNATNYQTTATNYGGGNSGFYQASLLDGANPAVANILQQSGLGQVVPNQ